jgi:general secretion pathway protein A
MQPAAASNRNPLFEQLGIVENPFGVTPNPRYFYQTKSHAEARASLIIGLECGLGFQALVAPPGMGKTTILFDVLERFNKSAHTAFLFQLQGGDSKDFLRYLTLELENADAPSDMVQVQDAINRLLINERRRGRRTILIIDEAQCLSTSVLETIRLLSNFETPSEKLLQIVLAGQPQLATKLAAPELQQLQQRISIARTLVPLEREETEQYVEHRLKVAGYRGQPLFASEAVSSIWEVSRGVPRDINTLCFNALLLIAATGQKQISGDIMQEVIADLGHSEFTSKLGPVRASSLPSVPESRVETTASDPGLLEFYGLKRNPFETAPDASFLCLTSTYRAALGNLYSGILAHERMLVLTGESGAGKTHIVACLIELLRIGNVRTDYVLASQWPSCKRNLVSRTELPLKAGREFSVVFIDDAHELSDDSVEDIRLLATWPTQQGGLQFVLVGIPQLRKLFGVEKFTDFRVSDRTQNCLESLDRSEIENYIACRLRNAQWLSKREPIFDTEVLTALFVHSKGIPRWINLLCEGALVKGYSRRERTITATMIQEVAMQPHTTLRGEEKVPVGNQGSENAVLKAARVLFDIHMALKTTPVSEPPKPLQLCS